MLSATFCLEHAYYNTNSAKCTRNTLQFGMSTIHMYSKLNSAAARTF